MKILVGAILILSSLKLLTAQWGCYNFLRYYYRATTSEVTRRFKERDLLSNGYVLTKNDIEFETLNISPSNVDNSIFSRTRSAEILMEAARLISDANQTGLSSFGDNTRCVRGYGSSPLNYYPKYRPINGYGNNRKNPHWGTPMTSFGRFLPKNYDDGIYTIRRSVTGAELPNARHIVTEVYSKLIVYKKPPVIPNPFLNLFVLYVSHDMGQQFSTRSLDHPKSIRCCGSGNQKQLDASQSHHSCLPIPISKNDEFYSKGGIKCLNMVRSQVGSSIEKIQYGEVMNQVTAALDHSIIYGNEESMTKRIRTFSRGKINLGSKNLYPVDNRGNHLESVDNLIAVTIGALWPVIFSRFHNYLADGLAVFNPSWNDEKLFQEARRINIAKIQGIIYHGRVVEFLAGKKIDVPYDDSSDISTYIEFITAAYRFLHYYIPTETWLVNSSGERKTIRTSELIGRKDLLETHFDDLVRGALMQPVDYIFSEELSDKLFKNSRGFGKDLFATDIQRGRDHGLPTYLDVRKKCQLQGDFKTFDDLIAIFPQNSIDLLKKVYASVEDIDLVVGGTVESLATMDKRLIGETLGCIITEHYKNLMQSDAYFYSHKTNPYPFTPAQIDAINSFNGIDILCKMTNIEFVGQNFGMSDSALNPRVPCTQAKTFNFTAFVNY